MNQFLTNLKREAEENPTIAIGVGTALLAAAGKFIDAAAHAKGSRAYAKMVANSAKNLK